MAHSEAEILNLAKDFFTHPSIKFLKHLLSQLEREGVSLIGHDRSSVHEGADLIKAASTLKVRLGQYAAQVDMEGLFD